MSEVAALEREAARQQWLLRALWRTHEPAPPAEAWLRESPTRQQRGLQAYRVNAAASAERTLAIAYPTVAALIGQASFAALARDLWRRHAPEQGDLGEWGSALPDFIAASESLASEPYLADSARLDWLVHLASRAADAPEAPPALDALAADAPESLRLVLRPGCALLSSAWPLAAVWQAHQPSAGQGDERFDNVRAMFADGRGEHAFVWRDGFVVRVDAHDAGSAEFTRAVIDGESLEKALDAAADTFAFDQWLVQALLQRWLVAVQPVRPRSQAETP